MRYLKKIVINFLFLVLILVFTATCSFVSKNSQRPYDGSEMLIPIVFHISPYEDKEESLEKIEKWMKFVYLGYEDTNIRFYIKEISKDRPDIKPDQGKLEIYDMSFYYNEVNVYVFEDLYIQKDKPLSGIHHNNKYGMYCDQIISIKSEPNHFTLAHELGHFFSLEHVKDENNIMFSGDERIFYPSFTKKQKEKLNAASFEWIVKCHSPK